MPRASKTGSAGSSSEPATTATMKIDPGAVVRGGVATYSGGLRRELNVEAHAVEAADQLVRGAAFVETVQVIRPEILMQRSVGEHVVYRHQHGVAECDCRSQFAAS